MRPHVIIALIIAVPLVLFPAAFVWYLNLSSALATFRELRAQRKVGKAPVRKEDDRGL